MNVIGLPVNVTPQGIQILSSMINLHSEEEDGPPKEISDIPTLRDLYISAEVLPPQGMAMFKFNDKLLDKISIWRGDLTTLRIDAIVNAADRKLSGYGYLNSTIHFKGGTRLSAACDRIGGAEVGEVKITGGYDLPARYVLHAVGPAWSRSMGNEEAKANNLKSCYSNSLELAHEYSLRTVAFPCISTGGYGYPNAKAAEIALDAIRTFLDSPKGEVIERIIFCTIQERDFNIYKHLAPYFFPSAAEDDSVEEAS
jgi:O-acetyl-ADP-ribose deacetylase (regulator of RNase III)